MDFFFDVDNRKEALRAVTRYSMYSPMFYRTNLWTHSKHVAWLTEEIAELAQEIYGQTFSTEKARLMALIHDDHEIIMGDFQAGNKAILTTEQAASLKHVEDAAIKEVSKRFPEQIGDYCYLDLLEEASAVTSLESIVVKYADKYEALGEALHELFAGNHTFGTAVVTEYGHPPTPFDYYSEWFNQFPSKYPQMAPLLASGHPLFASIDKKINLLAVAREGKPHTAVSFRGASGYTPYDTWKSLICKHAAEEDLSDLIQQTEFL